MKAKDEAELLEHMAAQLRKDGKLSGVFTAWRDVKVKALEFLDDHAGGLSRIVDVGVGDLDHLRRWDPFHERAVSYLGIDGCLPVLEQARASVPEYEFRQLKFSELKEDTLRGYWEKPDLLIACDVLYHIPEDEVYQHLLDWLFTSAGQWVMLTHATDMAAGPGGAGPGSPGFGWIPRPFDIPSGWSVIHSAGSSTPSKQRLLVLERRS